MSLLLSKPTTQSWNGKLAPSVVSFFQFISQTWNFMRRFHPLSTGKNTKSLHRNSVQKKEKGGDFRLGMKGVCIIEIVISVERKLSRFTPQINRSKSMTKKSGGQTNEILWNMEERLILTYRLQRILNN
jgi:hypothetical protein